MTIDLALPTPWQKIGFIYSDKVGAFAAFSPRALYIGAEIIWTKNGGRGLSFVIGPLCFGLFVVVGD